MIGTRAPFVVGQRVRLSQYGKDSRIYSGKKAERHGTVTKVDEFNCPTVLWEGRRTATSYYPDFIDVISPTTSKRRRK